MSALETAAQNLAEFAENVREAGREGLLAPRQVDALATQSAELATLAKFYGARPDLGRLSPQFGRWRF